MINAKCPSCGKIFVCRKDEIVKCACATVKLTAEQSQSIYKQYGNACLCYDCLLAFTHRSEKQHTRPS